MRHHLRFFVVLSSLAITALVLWSPAAIAFGTIKIFGQNAEHSRITRLALACAEGKYGANCFEAKTLDSLAGELGKFGAVGLPDRSRRVFISNAHCSAGDFLDIPDYPRTKLQAQISLTKCRDEMFENLGHAVKDAAKLLDKDGNIRASQIPKYINCIYTSAFHGRAKCNVLRHLGLILHASQDFYAHSNWVDIADETLPVSLDNPPGLGRRGRTPWLDLRFATPLFPQGLISACGDIDSRFDREGGCDNRIRHGAMNKDTGQIDMEIGQGRTRRGAVNENFRHAVEAAIDDTIDKWAILQERLIETYGQERGAKMICAIAKDNPLKECT